MPVLCFSTAARRDVHRCVSSRHVRGRGEPGCAICNPGPSRRPTTARYVYPPPAGHPLDQGGLAGAQVAVQAHQAAGAKQLPKPRPDPLGLGGAAAGEIHSFSVDDGHESIIFPSHGLATGSSPSAPLPAKTAIWESEAFSFHSNAFFYGLQ
jgi:hypothetical protein